MSRTEQTCGPAQKVASGYVLLGKPWIVTLRPAAPCSRTSLRRRTQADLAAGRRKTSTDLDVAVAFFPPRDLSLFGVRLVFFFTPPPSGGCRWGLLLVVVLEAGRDRGRTRREADLRPDRGAAAAECLGAAARSAGIRRGLGRILRRRGDAGVR